MNEGRGKKKEKERANLMNKKENPTYNLLLQLLKYRTYYQQQRGINQHLIITHHPYHTNTVARTHPLLVFDWELGTFLASILNFVKTAEKIPNKISTSKEGKRGKKKEI